jgi:5'-nucleotidase
MKTIGIDVDQVLANLHDPWVEWGNAKFGTSHKEFTHWDDPTDWWGKAGLGFLRPHIYSTDIVLPIPGALRAVNAVRDMGLDILFVTSCNRDYEIEAAKKTWLSRHGFLKSDSEFLPRVNKSNAPADVLVDDGIHNVTTFKGQGVLVDGSHNINETWNPRIKHITHLPAFLADREGA